MMNERTQKKINNSSINFYISNFSLIFCAFSKNLGGLEKDGDDEDWWMIP